MRKILFWGLVTAIALLINVVITYLSIFVWKVDFHYSLTVAFISAIVLVASNYISRVKVIKSRLLVKDSLIILALSLNYTSAYFVSFIWRGSISYVMLIFFVTSIVAGILVANLTKSLFYACLALILAGILFTVLLVSPPLFYGHPGMVTYASEIAVTFAGRMVLIGIVFCLVGTLMGSLIGDLFASAKKPT